MAVEANALGDYLRARRVQVRPEDVGPVPARGVPGLRRDELAMLALARLIRILRGGTRLHAGRTGFLRTLQLARTFRVNPAGFDSCR